MTAFHRIIFDVDNVLADSMSRFCKKASERVGYEIKKEQIRSHKVIGSIALTPQAIFGLQSEVWLDWKNLPSLENCLHEKLLEFQKIDFEIYMATAAPLRLIPYVKQWLKRKKIHYDEFFHCAKERSKGNIQADALVDDAPEEVQAFTHLRRQGFLYLQPWNINARIPKAIQVRSLDDVLKYYGIEKAEDGTYRDTRWL